MAPTYQNPDMFEDLNANEIRLHRQASMVLELISKFALHVLPTIGNGFDTHAYPAPCMTDQIWFAFGTPSNNICWNNCYNSIFGLASISQLQNVTI